jgi:GNAT superfamily N-acetyltransferase
MPIPLTDILHPLNMHVGLPEILIQPVTSRGQLREFIKLPWKIYRDDPHWVPPLIRQQKEQLNPRKNPFFEHARVKFFLARRGDQTVGRVASVVNQAHNEFHDEKTGFFGFFECANDYMVAEKLLNTARDWLREQGMEVMRGPANFSSNDEWGMLIQGFDKSPVLMMTYNPPYYPEFMDRYGLAKAKDLYAYRMFCKNDIPERLRRMAEKIQKKENLTIRSIDMKDLDAELRRIKEVYNNAWSKNWGFVPMTDSEFNHLAKQLKPLIVPELVLMADVDGQPAGFSLTLPDYNQALKHINGRLFPFGLIKLWWYARKIDCVRILVMGVVHEYQRRGIDAIFYIRTLNAGVARGIKWGEMSWVLEDNEMMKKALETMGAKIYKTYRIYEMPI